MKKILAMVCAGMMLVATLGTAVFAASPTQEMPKVTSAKTESGETIDIVAISGEEALWAEKLDAATLEQLDVMAGGKFDPAAIFGDANVTLTNGDKVDLSQFKMLTKPFDVTKEDLTKIEEAVNVEIQVPEAKGVNGDFVVLHYSTVRNTWEAIKPSSVDSKSGTMMVPFKDLSPVVVLYKANGSSNGTPAAAATGSDTAASTTPKTGDVNAVMMYSVIALAAACAAVVMVARKRHHA